MLTALYLIAGLALVSFIPYIRKSLQAVDKANDWRAWPRFEPRYVTGFIWAVIAFGISLIFSPDTWTELVAMPWWAVIGFASGGTLIGDQLGKSTGSVIAKIRRH